MPGSILTISPIALPPVPRPSAGVAGGGDFQDVFASAVRNVESLGQEASASAERFLNGEGEELHTTVMANTRAELAFDMFLQTRNKVIGAYQEIMKMQL